MRRMEQRFFTDEEIVMIDYVNMKPRGKAEIWMRRNRDGLKAALLLTLIVLCGGIDGWLM